MTNAINYLKNARENLCVANEILQSNACDATKVRRALTYTKEAALELMGACDLIELSSSSHKDGCKVTDDLPLVVIGQGQFAKAVYVDNAVPVVHGRRCRQAQTPTLGLLDRLANWLDDRRIRKAKRAMWTNFKLQIANGK
jgi:hypothetical protein